MQNFLFAGIDFLFSSRGRIGRLPFWGYHLGMAVLVWFTMITLTMTYFGPMIDRVQAGEDPDVVVQTMGTGDMELFSLLVALLYAGFTWSTYAVTARRWHDRDKSGWWSLIGFIPFLGPLWIFIECGFLPGSRGANRFGDAPGTATREFAEVFE